MPTNGFPLDVKGRYTNLLNAASAFIEKYYFPLLMLPSRRHKIIPKYFISKIGIESGLVPKISFLTKITSKSIITIYFVNGSSDYALLRNNLAKNCFLEENFNFLVSLGI